MKAPALGETIAGPIKGYSQGVVTIDKTDFAMQGKAGDKKADMVELQLFIEAIKAK